MMKPRSLIVLLTFFLFCQYGCVSQKYRRNQSVHDEPMASSLVGTKPDGSPLYLHGIGDLKYYELAKMPEKIKAFPFSHFSINSSEQQDFAIDELNKFDCGIDTSFSDSHCAYPDTIEELDLMWELLSFLGPGGTVDPAQKEKANAAFKIVSEIREAIVKNSHFHAFRRDNSVIKLEISKILNCSIDFPDSTQSPYYLGTIRQRVGLIALYIASHDPSFVEAFHPKAYSLVSLTRVPDTLTEANKALTYSWNLTPEQIKERFATLK